jgi:hypothetical protein
VRDGSWVTALRELSNSFLNASTSSNRSRLACLLHRQSKCIPFIPHRGGFRMTQEVPLSIRYDFFLMWEIMSPVALF